MRVAAAPAGLLLRAAGGDTAGGGEPELRPAVHGGRAAGAAAVQGAGQGEGDDHAGLLRGRQGGPVPSALPL